MRVTGAGRRGISHSGVSRSAFGSRLRVPAAVIGRVGTASRHRCLFGRDGSQNRLFGGLGEPALPQDLQPILRLPFDSSLTANRYPLTAITYFEYSGRLPHVEANFACTYGMRDCHRPSRQKGLDSRRREEQRRELERSAIPSVETGQALNHFRLGAALLDNVEDALKSRLRLLEGGKNLAAEQASQRGGQRGRRLPAFTAGSLLFDRKDHLMVTKELKSLTDRAFAYAKPTLKMVEIEGSGGNIQQGVDFGHRARNP